MSRGGRYAPDTEAARIVGDVTRPRDVLMHAVRFAKAHTSRPLGARRGPSPLSTRGGRALSRRRAGIALRFATLLNEEARALAEAGADVIQFDEPTFNVYVDKVRDWGVTALERCVDGVKATTAVHICYGYGISQVLAWKNSNRDWSHYSHTLPLLAESRIDQVSVECAASGVDPACSGASRTRTCWSA